jgi:hypothetical protein
VIAVALTISAVVWCDVGREDCVPAALPGGGGPGTG